MKIGLIGFGSIGKRHAENLTFLGYSDLTLLRKTKKDNEYGYKEIYSEDEFYGKDFDFIIISNPTSEHFYYLKRLINEQKNILVEKPIVRTRKEINELKNLLKDYTGIGFCSFNTRFHHGVKKVQQFLRENFIGRIYSARFFIGQYLPDWRQGSDYRSSYSAKEKMGGGVLLDLIHEIDLAQLFFGTVKDDFHAIVNKVSDLEIETEDIAEIHYKSSKDVIVSIHLDYLVRGYSRYFEIIGENGRIYCDLYNNKVIILGDGNEILSEIHFSELERNTMYLEMMEYYINCLKDKIAPTPSLKEALMPVETAILAKNFRK